jgi:Mg-chelatase subunit ChlD
MTTEPKKKTLICVILDESGSMATKKADVIGGFNQFLRDQKALTVDEMRLSLTKFNTLCSTVYSAMPVAAVPELTEATYVPGGNTALFDAVAETVRLADKDKLEDERVLVLVMTDGQENSSRETTKAQIQAIIAERTARGNWSFAYIGENPERWARETGASVRNAVQYQHGDP